MAALRNLTEKHSRYSPTISAPIIRSLSGSHKKKTEDVERKELAKRLDPNILNAMGLELFLLSRANGNYMSGSFSGIKAWSRPLRVGVCGNVKEMRTFGIMKSKRESVSRTYGGWGLGIALRPDAAIVGQKLP
ncbi:hypothetical protein DL93DRAFT_2159827 [Clavulina sp. PMI_390]|nr:hypothetical protein DL93DRAFT_2159827 [Clavulina sp. PMI_390]